MKIVSDILREFRLEHGKKASFKPQHNFQAHLLSILSFILLNAFHFLVLIVINYPRLRRLGLVLYFVSCILFLRSS